MILYYFNKPNDLTLYKMKIKKSSIGRSRARTINVVVDDDIRKCIPYHNSFELDAEEGVVRYKRFWLHDEDDERAEKIKTEYLNEQQKKLEKRLEKMRKEREQD